MSAATVELDAFQFFPASNYAGSTCLLKIWYNRPFLAADNTPIKGGPDFYESYSCPIVDGVPQIPVTTLVVTLNALDPNPQSITVQGQLFTNNGTRARDKIFTGNGTSSNGWVVYDPDPATTITYAQLALQNQGNYLINPPSTYFTEQETINYFGTLSPAPNASAITKGITKLSVAPLSAVNPIAVGDNDPRLSGNEYVITRYGALTTNTAAQNATAIAAAVTAANLVGASVSVPLGTFSTNSVAISAPLIFESAGAILAPATGQTITITKSITADQSRHFSNAVAGQGTIAFTNNRVLWFVYAEWWGAVGDDSTDNAIFLNAASNALVTNNISGLGSGFIFFGPGIYRIGSLWTIGSTSGGGGGLGQFSGISLSGSNGLTGTQLKWNGSTSGEMIKFVRGRHLNIQNIDFTSNIAKGTTVGVWFSGAANQGEETSRVIMENCNVNGFHIGIQPGNQSPDTTSAGEIKLINVVCDSNDYGYYSTGGGNTLVISIDTCSFYNNTTCGLKVGGGSGDTHITNCGFVNNAADIQFDGGWAPTIAIEKNRFECAVGSVPIANASGSVGIVRVANNNFAGTAPTGACLNGRGNWEISGNAFGADADTTWKVWSNADNASGSLKLIQNRIQNTTAVSATVPVVFQLETATTGQVGLRYESRGNHYDIVGVTTKFDDVLAGIVGQDDLGNVIAIAQQKVVSGVLTGDVLSFGNQVAIPSVAYGGGLISYKTADTGATSQTNMTGSQDGQIVRIWFANSNRTIVNNSNQKLWGATNFTGTANDTLTMQRISGVWYELCRSIN